MAVDVTLTDVASGYNRGAINDNFTALETALQDALSRSGGSPNTMSADIDLNSNNLLNAGVVNASSLKVAGVTVTDATYVPDWKGSWLTSTSYVINDMVIEAGSTYICIEAHTSGTFSTDLTAVKWALFAQQGSAGAGTGDMLAANNLSDVSNIATSRSNLGLGDVAVQNKSSVDITGGTIVGITDLAIADGGTGSSTASTAFTALKQAATETATGVVEKATSAEGTTPVADKFPDTIIVEEMITARSSLTEDTKQVTTSGTAFDFSDIPAGTKEIIIAFDEISLTGTNHLLVQLGDIGGIETSSYASAASTSGADTSSTSGFIVYTGSASAKMSGIMSLYLTDSSSNLWTSSHSIARTGSESSGGGRKILSGELTQLRLTRTGSDTFDAGAVNILYR